MRGQFDSFKPTNKIKLFRNYNRYLKGNWNLGSVENQEKVTFLKRIEYLALAYFSKLCSDFFNFLKYQHDSNFWYYENFRLEINVFNAFHAEQWHSRSKSFNISRVGSARVWRVAQPNRFSKLNLHSRFKV